MGYSFTRKQCIRALLRIGFANASTRRGKHEKYKPPFLCDAFSAGTVQPFIMIPRHDFYCQDAIVREIEKMCGEGMKRRFLEHL